jgi:hypothetical protein
MPMLSGGQGSHPPCQALPTLPDEDATAGASGSAVLVIPRGGAVDAMGVARDAFSRAFGDVEATGMACARALDVAEGAGR